MSSATRSFVILVRQFLTRRDILVLSKRYRIVPLKLFSVLHGTGRKIARNPPSHVESVARTREHENIELKTLSNQRQKDFSAHVSLLHAMCSVDTDLASTMLDRLRRGTYDIALGLKSSATPANHADISRYPWENEPGSSDHEAK